jgi:hypothetical protein
MRRSVIEGIGGIGWPVLWCGGWWSVCVGGGGESFGFVLVGFAFLVLSPPHLGFVLFCSEKGKKGGNCDPCCCVCFV